VCTWRVGRYAVRIDDWSVERSATAKPMIGQSPRIRVDAHADGRSVDDDAAGLAAVDDQTHGKVCTQPTGRSVEPDDTIRCIIFTCTQKVDVGL